MTLTNIHVLLASGAVFGLIGFLRGVAREIITITGIIVAYLIIVMGESFLVGWTNKLFKIAIFVLRGGLAADDPTVIWSQLSDLSPLIGTDGEKMIFRLAGFLLAVLLAYVVGNKFLSGKAVTLGPLVIYPDLPLLSRFLGLASGLIEGYLIIYFVLPEIFPKTETVISVPTGATVDFLGSYLPFVFVGFVAILIAFGLRSASLKK